MENIGGNALVIREVNTNLVRQCLKEQGQATKRQIAERTGLSIVTVGTVLQQLVQEHEVLEAGQVSSMGGRPAQQYAYNDVYKLVLVLFPLEKAGKRIIHSNLVSLTGRSLKKADTVVDEIHLAVFEEIIDEWIAEYPAVSALGIGLPGTESDGKMAVSDYEYLRGVAVAEHFRKRYRLPVVIENDVNAAVTGYCRVMKKPADTTVVYLYFPDRFPPGAGIYLDGRLYRGPRGFAGEIAGIPLDAVWGPELYASPSALTGAVAKLVLALGGILNPDEVVLNGSFLTSGHLQAVQERCEAVLPPEMVPRLLLTQDFAADYVQGMIEQTLLTLAPNVQLTKSKA
ncbi:ROK family transcriptional regulator [Paenibacillus tepidiphilus]|uniref:ROK family transcriptional regulator n=1 Tax=Paenibacillus tepidiphilus TaxID=2608683 RepID=UPI00123B6FE3|nr:ROK family transcriptional regulator [Paenibacillus tepidiphilus]